jgi:hypothetical protein
MIASRGPTQLVAPINPERRVEADRNLFCGSYDDCLDYAIGSGWSSWTCARCPVFALGPTPHGLESHAQRRTQCIWLT